LLFCLKSPLIVDPIHNIHRLQLVSHLAAYLELSHKPFLASDRVLPAFHRLIHYGMGLQLTLPRLLIPLAPISTVPTFIVVSGPLGVQLCAILVPLDGSLDCKLLLHSLIHVGTSYPSLKLDGCTCCGLALRASRVRSATVGNDVFTEILLMIVIILGHGGRLGVLNEGWDEEGLAAVEGGCISLECRLLRYYTARDCLREVILEGVMVDDKVLVLGGRG
jgi:hypothetical protein